MPVRLFLLIPLLALFAACTPRETNVQRGDREQILHRGIGPELTDLDPHLASTLGDIHVLTALFEGLVADAPDGSGVVPALASRWTTSADGLTWTFHLRENLLWSDRTPLTSTDLRNSFHRALSPGLAAPNASLLYLLLNAEAYHLGRQTDFDTVGVAAPDPLTLRLTLEHPAPHFLQLLTHPIAFPVPLHLIASTGATHARGNPWARPGTFVGNGPFTLSEWRRNQFISATKNPAYWDADTVRLNAIHFHPIDSVEAEERAFRSGQLHLTESVPPSRIPAYRRDQPSLLRLDPTLGTYFYRLNVNRPALNDPRIRRALALSLNRAQITHRILNAGEIPSASLVPAFTADYQPPPGLAFDPERARLLLAEAGYPEGRGLPTLELLYNTSENHRAIAEAVQQMWRDELGIEVRLANQEFASTLQARQTGQYQILRSSWFADYPSPLNFLAVFTSRSTQNFTGWSHPEYDHLLYEAQRTPDRTARHALFHRAESLLLEHAPIIPLYTYTHAFLLQPSVKGWSPHPMDRRAYKHVYLTP